MTVSISDTKKSCAIKTTKSTLTNSEGHT